MGVLIDFGLIELDELVDQLVYTELQINASQEAINKLHALAVTAKPTKRTNIEKQIASAEASLTQQLRYRDMLVEEARSITWRQKLSWLLRFISQST